jgi:hypothetical protein
MNPSEHEINYIHFHSGSWEKIEAGVITEAPLTFVQQAITSMCGRAI